MKEVVCWCCEKFKPLDELLIYKKNFMNGICTYNNTLYWSDSPVCKDFILRKGLFTKRIIPDKCINYKSQHPEKNSIKIKDLLK